MPDREREREREKNEMFPGLNFREKDNGVNHSYLCWKNSKMGAALFDF